MTHFPNTHQPPGTRQNARNHQARAIETRRRIANGAIEVLARAGVAGLTHRSVAQASGVSLAATTYHYDTKAAMLVEASQMLLNGYLDAFRRLDARLASGEEKDLTSIRGLVDRVVNNALGRERIRSTAWCQIILHGGRNAAGRAMAQGWYGQLDRIWHAIADRLEPGCERHVAVSAIDHVVGLTFLLHSLNLDAATAHDILAGRLDVDLIADGHRLETADGPETPDATYESLHASGKREEIIQAAIDILVEDGPANVSYRTVAERTGMVRSGPSYYFKTIDSLLETAQMALFTRAKARYREGIGEIRPSELDRDRLVDLTTAIFFSEAMKFARENLGYYSVWLGAAHNPALRPAVFSSLRDQNRAWRRRLAALGVDAPPGAALRLQACFVGKLIRAIAGGTKLSDMANARTEFAAALADVAIARP